MAKLTVMGPYEGPGEKITAEYLAKHLPESWHVIPGRKLNTATRDDVDLFILGENKLFVFEEKYWGPIVAVGDQRWTVQKLTGAVDDRDNPLNASTAKARKVAGWLRGAIPGFSNVKFRPVVGGVILSYPDISIREKVGFNLPNTVFELGHSVKFFSHLDGLEIDHNFADFRIKIEALLLDLADISHEFKTIGAYETERELEPQPGVRVFEAEHKDEAERVLLKCYENTYWENRGDKAENFIKREIKALSKIIELNRSWRYHPAFQFEKKDWTVVPIVRPQGVVSLAEIIEDPQRAGFLNLAGEVALDAFRALDEIHSNSVVHKALTPNRIWLGKGLRVRFNDFFLSHIDGEKSVVQTYEDEGSRAYRDNEALESLEFADGKSDVYALAFCLATWITGVSIHQKADLLEALVAKAQNNNLASVLTEALNDDRLIRPTAAGMVVRLEPARPEVAPPVAEQDFVGYKVGSIVNNRFKLEKKLGSGGMGTTWLASETDDGGSQKVLKVLHDAQNYKAALKEYAVAGLKHEGCSFVVESSEKPEPGYLAYNYVPGLTLLERSKDVSFGLGEAQLVLSRALKALSYIHDQKLLHGDLSPKNLIVDEDLKTTLIDFGLSVRVGEAQKFGTPSTISPEVSRAQNLDFRSDIYSLAATFVIVMLGRPPYAGDSSRFQGRDFTVVPLTEIEMQQWGDDGTAFLNVLLAACSPQMEGRPSTTEEFFELIQRAKPLPVEKLPEKGAERLINPVVASIRQLYVRSKIGSPVSLGIDDPFAAETYVPTNLDSELLEAVSSGGYSAIFLTGNPGDGKTSFLQKLEVYLGTLGAQGQTSDSGWNLQLNGQSFMAVYDASESTDNQTSDDLVLSALRPAQNGETVALFAINDGRLRQFFDDHEEEFPLFAAHVQNFFKTGSLEEGKLLIVDLKARSLVAGGATSLTGKMLDVLTAPDKWAMCSGCAVESQCSIKANRDLLLEQARPGVMELLTTSHLRRRKRATLRQVRSTLGWLITGDIGCEDVHEEVNKNIDLRLSNKLLPELAFDSNTTDPLIEEWQRLDPSNLISPAVDEYLSVQNLRDSTLDEAALYSRTMRRVFFGVDLLGGVVSEHLVSTTRAHLHLNTFEQILEDASEDYKKLILNGISRLVGAPGYRDTDLVVSQSKELKGWAALKPFLAADFELQANKYENRFIETSPDLLLLTHLPSGELLKITLDTAEVILRSADGDLLSDDASKAIRYEIESFTNKLARTIADRILLVQPSGEVEHMVKSGKLIEFEKRPTLNASTAGVETNDI